MLEDDIDYAVKVHYKALQHARDVCDLVIDELDRAMRKFPTWPTDPLHALAVLGEEYGELTKEVLQTCYEPEKSSPGAITKEAIQTAAMAIRWVISLDEYKYKAGDQHDQGHIKKPRQVTGR